MVLIENIRHTPSHRGDTEYFYAWVRNSYLSTSYRVSWDRKDDIGYLIKYLVLHNLKIDTPRLRRNYVHLSVEDQKMLNDYITQLQEYIL